MAVRGPDPAPAGAADIHVGYLHKLPWPQELLSELEGAIAAGGSPWHLAELRASRELMVQLMARARQAARAPRCLAELEQACAGARARNGWRDTDCHVEEHASGSYQVLTTRDRIVWWGDAHCAVCARRKALEASCVRELLWGAS
jgi:hypothetical protein